MHPKERRLAATRRDFLLRSGGAAFALTGAGSFLAACSNSTSTGGGGGTSGGNPNANNPLGLPLARPNVSVTLPRYEDPIASERDLHGVERPMRDEPCLRRDATGHRRKLTAQERDE